DNLQLLHRPKYLPSARCCIEPIEHDRRRRPLRATPAVHEAISLIVLPFSLSSGGTSSPPCPDIFPNLDQKPRKALASATILAATAASAGRAYARQALVPERSCPLSPQSKRLASSSKSLAQTNKSHRWAEATKKQISQEQASTRKKYETRWNYERT